MTKDEINAFLGVGTSYQGKLQFQGSVRIDGEFSGEVDSEGTLIVGRDAKLIGQFRVGQIVLSGNVQGEIITTTRAVFHKQASFVGKLKTPLLVVEEGAQIEGDVSMGSREGIISSAEGGSSLFVAKEGE